jgi:outer membrane protein OmpA-like peptidoglycan-associated protein
VASYINRYTKILVKISAYTNALGPKEVDLALSQQQADSISKFLLACGLDARLTYAVGYGGTHLVQKNSYSWGASDNYRIEITLEKLYV